ncbi:MAG: hypothetical protein IEMM0008_0014 [bacterium]|nr:MAG: hypothetical protein IEMM0008_0014 [bacterium]
MKILKETNEVILSREEYEALIEQIEDLEDVIDAYKVRNEESVPLEDVIKELGVNVQIPNQKVS